jgi:hypothetical protein
LLNQYKRLDVYRCKLQSHDSFAGWVSVYHVLKVKRCLPEGCIYFLWHCRLLDKGGACRKGYHHPGKNCSNCQYYYDEKIHKVPVMQLSTEDYSRFRDDLESFEDWLTENRGRRLEVYGRVNHVGPLLAKDVYHNRSRVTLKGYLANFAECYLGRTHFEDFVYLRLSGRTQHEQRLARGDLLEFEAELDLDEGRLVLAHPGRFEFAERSPEPFRPEDSAALVASRTATVLESQSERCLRCEQGRLVDVTGHGALDRRSFSRQLFCLQGVEDPSLCCYNALKSLGIRPEA